MTARRVLPALLAILAAGTVAACGSSGSPSGGSPSPSTGAPTEVHPPGDIPDNQAFVPYSGAGFRLVVPEGWSRTNQGKSVQFSDKYNSITVTPLTTNRQPTVASARGELPTIRSSTKSFHAGHITTVQRSAGTAVLITYQDLSPVNAVTGKVTQRAVERYELWRGGHEVVLTLAAPVGSDNVDPWRKVTDGFAWTG